MLITREEKKESLRHYWRMRKCAKGLTEWDDYYSSWNMNAMENAIGENWEGEFCILCKNYFNWGSDCIDCPLTPVGCGCNDDDSPWHNMSAAHSWPEWIEAATEMARVIMRLEVREEEG
jgi:hypothetical protein